MNTSSTKPSPRVIRAFSGFRLSAALTAAFLLAVFVGGCKEETPGIVGVCISPTVTSTSPASGASGVSLSKTIASNEAADAAAVKVITATFSTPMDVQSLNNATFTLLQGTTPISGTVSYTDTTAVFVAPNGLIPNQLYTATITTGAKDLVGTGLTGNYVWSFTTVAAGVPALVSPADLAVNQPSNPTLVWSSVAGAGTYRLQVSTSSAFSTTFYDNSSLTGISQVVPGLAPATSYYWRVNATISGVTGVYSSVWRFTTLGPPAAPLLVSPLNTAQNQPTTLTLSWLASVGAATYRLQIDTTSAFTSPVLLFNDSTITSTSEPISGLEAGKTYYWRVNAKNAAGTSAYASRNFSTGLVPPQPPLLSAPPDGDTVLTTSPSLSWNASTGAVTYRLQVDTSAAFTGPTFVFDDSTITGLLQPISGLTNGATYYWRVNAKNSGGTSAYSEIWSFVVASLPPPSLLGSASTYGIMATSAITSTGNSIINGDVSLDPGTSMTGFPPAIVNGAIHINDTQSAQARADLLSAYNYLKNLPPGTTIGAGADLGALYPSGIAPGTYTSGSTMLVSTPLVLDAGGNANAVWVFQIGSSLTTGASVTLLNGADENNVYWVPTLDATIGSGTTFHGTIVSGRDVTAVTGTTINGRILAGATTAGTIALQNTVVNVP